jgi:hypothetical protein
MSVNGNWVLHYSWGPTNSYAQTNITFNPDGTFTGPLQGQWRQREGTLMLSFNTGPAKYGGTVDSNVASGAMSTFQGLNGCWYLLKEGTVGVQVERAKPTHDASGKKL